MREHHPDVATRAKHRSFRRFARNTGDGTPPAPTEMVPNRADGQGQVRARVSIWNRENIDPVQLGALVLRVLASCDQRPPKARTVHISDLGRAQTRLLVEHSAEAT